MKVSKEVKKTRFYESTLLNAYRVCISVTFDSRFSWSIIIIPFLLLLMSLTGISAKVGYIRNAVRI